MELSVLLGNQPVKCVLMFSATDQSPTKMKYCDAPYIVDLLLKVVVYDILWKLCSYIQ